MTSTTQSKKALILGVCLTALLTLQACGGGSSSPSVTPPPTAVVPPPPPPPVGKTVVGPISGFGSVIVNGLRYETNSATFTIDGVSGTQADLKVGQIVKMRSEKDSSGSDVASSVDYEEILEGPVTSINLANNSVVILGRTILVENTTSFDDDISPSSLEGIAVGDILEISGEFQPALKMKKTITMNMKAKRMMKPKSKASLPHLTQRNVLQSLG